MDIFINKIVRAHVYSALFDILQGHAFFNTYAVSCHQYKRTYVMFGNNPSYAENLDTKMLLQ